MSLKTKKPLENLSRYDVLILVALIAIIQLAGYLLGLVTRSEVQDWYTSLEKSALTPPDSVFSIVWPIMYLLISISAWFLYLNRHHKNFDRATNLFIIQLLINWGWTLIFFYGHFILPALVWLAALLNFVLLTILAAWRVSKTASLLLVPYFIWISYAFYLNLMIWVLN